MTKTWVRVLLWLLTAATAAMIFGFSGQDGDDSLGLSHQLVQPIVEWVQGINPDMSEEASENLYWTLQQVVRKCGHLTEYALLGCWIRLLCESYGLRRKVLITWISGTLYAATDELHQMFSPDRSPALLDVGIDSLGVVIGMMIAATLFCRKKKEEQP